MDVSQKETRWVLDVLKRCSIHLQLRKFKLILQTYTFWLVRFWEPHSNTHTYDACVTFCCHDKALWPECLMETFMLASSSRKTVHNGGKGSWQPEREAKRSDLHPHTGAERAKGKYTRLDSLEWHTSSMKAPSSKGPRTSPKTAPPTGKQVFK